MRHKLFCRSSGAARLAHIPLVRLAEKLLFVDIDAFFFDQRFHNFGVKLLIRRVERNRQSEAICQRLAFLNAVCGKDLPVCRISVRPGLLDEITPVRCDVDQYILRLNFDAAFQNRLEMLILDFRRLEREVVDEDDEPASPVGHQLHDLCDIENPRLRYADHPQAPVAEIVQKRFYAGGFSGSFIAVKQNIIRPFSSDEDLCIADQLPLLNIISDEIVKGNRIVISDSLQVPFHTNARYFPRIPQ